MTRPPITPGPLHSFRTASPDYAPEFGIYAADNPDETIVRTTGEHAAANAEAFAALPDLLEALEMWQEAGQHIADALRTAGYHSDFFNRVQDAGQAALTKAGYTL
jgi:hypothetical protein